MCANMCARLVITFARFHRNTRSQSGHWPHVVDIACFSKWIGPRAPRAAAAAATLSTRISKNMKSMAKMEHKDVENKRAAKLNEIY